MRWTCAATLTLGAGGVLFARSRAGSGRLLAVAARPSSWVAVTRGAERALGAAAAGPDRALALADLHGVALIPVAAAVCTAAALGLSYLGERRPAKPNRPGRSAPGALPGRGVGGGNDASSAVP